MVHVHLDGKISFWKDGSRLAYKKLKEPKKKEQDVAKESQYTSIARSATSRKNKHKTPWGRFNRVWLNKDDDPAKKIVNTG